ncbi:MAG TPA: DegT/DnrJ/EryC1/StrS family aminotransferase [Thermoleophilaceae bacterium]|nr:DegT/DnrJ/EryC1/StrS family aminotransferase [Thermoleophilaceae bacterium]
MSGVPFVDLGRMHNPLEAELKEVFEQILSTGAFNLGVELERFEAEFAAYCGAAHCVGICDGTEALRLALVAMGAGPGTEVVTTPSTFIATVEAVAATGARPVLADIDPATRCLDPERVAAAIGPNTVAVVPVHLYGRPAPMAELREACGEIPLLEDAAQAHGADLDGRRTGTLGRAAGFSFYPTKNLGALGDGGAVVTDDEDLAAVVRSMRHHGSAADDANQHVRPGRTSRLDNLQAALLSVKLRELDRWNEERRTAAARYRDALDGLPITLPQDDPPGGSQVFHLFAVELDDRDRVRDELRAAGIGAAIHYPNPAHLNPAWSELAAPGDLPAAESLAARTLSLPMFPGIEDAEIDRVAEALRTALG